MKMKFSSQRRETFLFLTVNMTAVTPRANRAAFIFLTSASVTITIKASETGAVVRAKGIDAVGIEIT